MRSRKLTAAVATAALAGLSSTPVLATTRTITARVADPDGVPAVSAAVHIQYPFLRGNHYPLTPGDNPGEFAFSGTTEGFIHYRGYPGLVIAALPGQPAAWGALPDEGGRFALDLRLPRTRTVRVKLEPWTGAPPLPDNARLLATRAALMPYLGNGREPVPGRAEARRVDADTFEFADDASSTDTVLLLDAPGYLHFHASPPLDTRGGEVVLTLPRPGSMSLTFTPGERFRAAPPYDKVTVMVMREEDGAEIEGFRMNHSTGSTSATKPGSTVTFDFAHLAPGRYQYEFLPGEWDKPGRRPGPVPGATCDWTTVTEGQRVEATQLFDDIDPAWYRGNLSADLTVLMPDGKPAAGEDYKLTVMDRKGRGADVTSGTVPADGRLRLSGLACGFDQATTDPNLIVRYDFHVGKRESTRLNFWKYDGLSKGFRATSDTLALTVNVPVDVGDQAPDVTLQRTGGGTFRIADFRGKVLVLDFWATWCGPCQQPMAELNAMADTPPEAWKNRVVLAGASIDDDMDTLLGHIRAKGWERIIQGWCGSKGGTGFESAPAKAYGIRYVPTTVIITPDGHIVWRGHSAGMPKEMIAEQAGAQ